MKNNQLLLKTKLFYMHFLLFVIWLMCQLNWIKASLKYPQKAFGRVDWDFISSDLQKFGYGEKFIRMIKVAYTDIQSKIKINGLLSDSFTLMQGVHWECLLSMVLYITVA